MLDDAQRRQVLTVLLKVVGIAVSVGLVISLGLVAIYRASGLNEVAEPTAGASATQSAQPLPTKAIEPTPSPSASSSPSASATASAKPKPKRKLVLVATPNRVGPGQRINLTGTFPGRDGVVLAVERKEGGRWTSFAGLTTTVRGGAFATFILTSRVGPQKFRVSGGGKSSNPVTVRVG